MRNMDITYYYCNFLLFFMHKTCLPKLVISTLRFRLPIGSSEKELMILLFGSYQFAVELTKDMLYLQLFGKEQIIPSPAG